MMKRFSIVVLLLVLGIGFWSYRAHQKSLAVREHEEIYSNIQAAATALDKWNADSAALDPFTPVTIRELAVRDGPLLDEALANLNKAEEVWNRRIRRTADSPACKEYMTAFFLTKKEAMAVHIDMKNLALSVENSAAGMNNLKAGMSPLLVRDDATIAKFKELLAQPYPCDE
jgi:hypothetical protein